MTRLTSDHISSENPDSDPTSATSLNLSHRCLTDVSCLSSYRKLEKLDLNFNCLSSLESLSSCVNLKWLSVVENKLESLKGIENFSKLTVFNAGKNKLQSMDEISSVVSLRAVILNDNNITSICKLDELTYLNTLVLSRNPIREIGDALMKTKSLTKLSLSHCQLEAIGSSLTSCVDLKEARLSHNNIASIPPELARNTRLQNLDMGNNAIDRWSDLKALSELPNLRNLNLHGNPIAEKAKLVNKIKQLVPNLRIFNSKPMEGVTKREKKPKEDAFKPMIPLENTDAEAEDKVQKSKAKKAEKKVKRSSTAADDLPSTTNTDAEKQTKRKKPQTDTKSYEKGVGIDKDADDLDQDIPAKNIQVPDKTPSKAALSGKDGIVIEHVKKKNKKDSGIMGLPGLKTKLEIGLGGSSMWDD